MLRFAIALSVLTVLSWVVLFGLKGVLRKETFTAAGNVLTAGTVGSCLLILVFLLFSIIGGIHG